MRRKDDGPGIAEATITANSTTGHHPEGYLQCSHCRTELRYAASKAAGLCLACALGGAA